MKSLWRVVAIPVFIFSIFILIFWVYLLGSAVGGILETMIRAVPGLLYGLPGNALAILKWLGAICWSLVTDPLHTICVILGMLLVITYFRGVAGHFNKPSDAFRGSTVRTAEDVFPDLEKTFIDRYPANFSRIRGSSIDDYESHIHSSSQSAWSQLWDKLKTLFTRSSAGDDLL